MIEIYRPAQPISLARAIRVERNGVSKWADFGAVSDSTQANRYTYTGDDPVNYVDPSGTSVFGDVLTVIGFGLAVAGVLVSAPIWSSAITIVGLAVAIYGVAEVISDNSDPGRRHIL